MAFLAAASQCSFWSSRRILSPLESMVAGSISGSTTDAASASSVAAAGTRGPLAVSTGAAADDAARGKWLSIIGMALATARNYDPFKSPTHFKLTDLMKKLDKT